MRFPNIETERKRMGLSKPQFAKRINISRTTYHNIQKGAVEPLLKHFIAMSDLFSVSIDYLVGRW